VGGFMEIYVEEASSEDKCLKKIYKKYGKSVNIIRRHTKIVSHLFGLYEKELCMIYFSLEGSQKPSNFDVENKNYEKNAAFIDAHVKRLKMEDDKKEGSKSPYTASNITQKIKESQNVDDRKEKIDLSSDSYEKLRDIVEGLASKIEMNANVAKEHKNLEKIKEVLKDNDFSDEYIKGMVDDIKQDLTLVELEDYEALCKRVLDYIASSINVKPFTPISEKKVVAFVGPTGVGKTTSLVKLAALHFVHIQNAKRDRPQVHVITTDGYKIGAVSHIEKYCNCMELSLSVADTVSSLRASIDIHKEKMDMIFIDSSGRNPNDKAQLAEVEKFLNSISKDIMEVHLVINAGTKIKDIALIMEKYKGCRYDYVIISKLDETGDVGNVVSVLSKEKVPLSYVTLGQVVPTDITFAGRRALLDKMRGFEGLREYIEESYRSEDERFGDNIWLTKQKI